MYKIARCLADFAANDSKMKMIMKMIMKMMKREISQFISSHAKRENTRWFAVTIHGSDFESIFQGLENPDQIL